MKKYHPEEFIGCKIKITASDNQSLKGLSGTIINETKCTFTIKDKKGERKTILKQGSTFMISNKEIQGKDIAQRPEERIKK